jgi:hypothetical protein
MRKSAAVSPVIQGRQKKDVEQKATPKTKTAGGAIPEKDREVYRGRLAAVKKQWKTKKNGGPMQHGTASTTPTTTTSTTRMKKSKEKDQQKSTRYTRYRPFVQPRETASRRQHKRVVAVVEQRMEPVEDIQTTTRVNDSRRKDVSQKGSMESGSECPKHACAMVTAITVALFFSAMGCVPAGQSLTTTKRDLCIPQVWSKEPVLVLPSSPANDSLVSDTIPSAAPVVQWPSVPSYTMVMEETGPFFPSPAPVLVAPHPTVVVPVLKVPPEPMPAADVVVPAVVPPTTDVALPESVEISMKPQPMTGRRTEKDLVWMAVKWIVKWSCWLIWKVVRFVFVRTLKTLWGSYGPNVRWCFLFVTFVANRIDIYKKREKFRQEHRAFRQWAIDFLHNHPTKRFSADELVVKYQREEKIRLNNLPAHLKRIDSALRRSSEVNVVFDLRNGKGVNTFCDISYPLYSN